MDLRHEAISSEAAHQQFMSMYDPVYDGTAAQAGFRSGDLIVGLEVCEAYNNEGTAEVEVTAGDMGASAGGGRSGSRRQKVDITGGTTDEEWVHFAQSCEQLEPGSDTVMWVRRKEKSSV